MISTGKVDGDAAVNGAGSNGFLTFLVFPFFLSFVENCDESMARLARTLQTYIGFYGMFFSWLRLNVTADKSLK